MKPILLLLALASVSLMSAAHAQTPYTLGPYAYDASGNITAIGADTFRYDPFGRLATANVAQHPQQYTYDRYGT